MASTEPSRGSRWTETERFWLTVCVMVFISILISWVPALGLPLGDDHQGRILGRMALHADNFVARGWSGSNYIADWMPYAGSPYAHHPPLPQFLHAGIAWLSDGASALGVRAIDFVGGIASATLIVAFVRRLSGSWLHACWALAGLAVSGFFWLFGRSLGLVFAAAYFLVHVYSEERQARLAEFMLWMIAMLATLQSWQAALTIGLVAVYDLLRSRWRRAFITSLGIAIGFGLDVLWIESAAGIGALRGHLEDRVAAADYSAVEWFARQVGFLHRFETIPVVIVTLVALVVGLRDRRYRPYVGAAFLSMFLFAVVFYQNAWVHEYWNWRLAFVLALGMAALGGWFVSKSRPDWAHWLVGVIAVAVVAVPLLRLNGDLYATQYVDGSDAGALVERTDFPDSQTIAWHYGGIEAPRWLSWYTGMPTREIDLENPPDRDTLVLVRILPDDLAQDLEVVDALGSYVVVRVGALVGSTG